MITDKKHHPRAVPELVIQGHVVQPTRNECFGDDRGYFTSVDLPPSSKRAYVLENHQAGTVRAFHGHRLEDKTLSLLQGACIVIVMCMKTLQWRRFSLTDRAQNKLHIPAGAYHGIVTLTSVGILLVVSNRTYEESVQDDHRLPYDYLGIDVWKVSYR